MRKRLRFWPLIVMLAVMLAGCAGDHQEAAALPTLSATTWPTPVMTPAQPEATPFPKISPDELPPAARQGKSATALNELPAQPAAGSDEAPVNPTANKPFNDLAIEAMALVNVSDVDLRQEPNQASSVIGHLTHSEPVGILTKATDDAWVYGVTLDEQLGWLPTRDLRIIGHLADVPVSSDSAMAAQVGPAGTGSEADLSAAQTAAMSTTPEAAGSGPAASAQPGRELVPVTTAQVTSEALNLRQGPGANFVAFDTLLKGQVVSVLALNSTRDWALVESPNPGLGWVSLRYLAVTDSLSAVPSVLSASPQPDLPANQLAPIFDLTTHEPIPVGPNDSALPGSGRSEPVSQTRPEQTATPVASSGLAMPTLADLTPVATARLNVRQADLYRGPGTEFGPMGQTTADAKQAILALNRAADWALIRSVDVDLAWAPLKLLTVETGTLDAAPRILTAWVNSNEIPVYHGPGIFYTQIGTVAIDDLVAVLGVDETHSWLLIKPVRGGDQSWIERQFLSLNGDLAGIPQVAAPPPAPSPVAVAEENAAPAGPLSGKLVFQLSSGGAIMAINPDGTGLRQLTYGIDPVLSPDGQTVAFTRWQGDAGSLWLIDSDGTNERHILGEIKQAKGPAWSADGTRIVLNFQNGGRLEKKKVCQALSDDNSLPKIPLNVDPEDIGVEIDDGKPVLCWKLPPDPHWGLRVVNLADGSFQDLYGGLYAFRPTWDPNQDWRIVADAGNGLLETDVNREYSHNITNLLGDGSPVFSPDGRYLAVMTRQNDGSDIYRLNADGSGRVRLTQTPLWVTAEPGDRKPWNNVSPTWSPDGSRIAFLTDRTGRWEVWVMNSDGSNQDPLFSDDVNRQLQFDYQFVDERMLSWR